MATTHKVFLSLPECGKFSSTLQATHFLRLPSPRIRLSTCNDFNGFFTEVHFPIANRGLTCRKRFYKDSRRPCAPQTVPEPLRM